MEVHRQQCQSCGSIDVRNVIVREEGHAPMVFVRCCQCGELVARYRLRDYYHHGKGIDSFLRSLGANASDSAREYVDQFESIQEEALTVFEQVLIQLRDEGKDI